MATGGGYAIAERLDKFDFERTMKHPVRFEQLIHAELKEHRNERLERADCVKIDREWLRIGASEAQEVVKNGHSGCR